MINNIKKELKRYSDSKMAQKSKQFFKTGKGEYGEGDLFIGISVPKLRTIAKKFKEADFNNIETLLKSKIHEERLLGLLILVENFKNNKEMVYNFYLKNINRANNWDLIDLSSYKIIGEYLFQKDRSILFELANSENLWKRRASIVSTYTFIKNNDFKDTLKISELLINDKEDLIQKAVGWMLREVGKKDVEILEKFLNKNFKKMPRTMLRYSIEKLSVEKRKYYMG